MGCRAPMARRRPLRCRRSVSWARPECIRVRCPAGSPTPTSAPTKSSAPASTAAPCSPARSRGGAAHCPSVEDKINRFADKASHQIFLEPEGLTTHEYYPNGISTSLPFDIQYQLARTMPGLENAHILRPGVRHRVRLFRPPLTEEQLRDPADCRSVLRRPDQRNHGL